MSVLEYDDWCDAMNNTNTVISEVTEHRKQNLKWFCEELREIFGVCGEIESVKTAKDGSIIDVIFVKNHFKINFEVFKHIYCPMMVMFDVETGYLKIRLSPNIKTESEDTIH